MPAAVGAASLGGGVSWRLPSAGSAAASDGAGASDEVGATSAGASDSGVEGAASASGGAASGAGLGSGSEGGAALGASGAGEEGGCASAAEVPRTTAKPENHPNRRNREKKALEVQATRCLSHAQEKPVNEVHPAVRGLWVPGPVGR